MGVQMDWSERRRSLSLRLAPDSRMLPPLRRTVEVRLGETVRSLVFDGSPVDVKF
jgi:hypothetical protein